MTLSEGYEGEKYYIKSVTSDPTAKKRLNALGITENAEILITARKKSGDMIVQICGSRIAIEKNVAALISLQGKARSRKLT